MSNIELSAAFKSSKVVFLLPHPEFTLSIDAKGKGLAQLAWKPYPSEEGKFKAAHSDPYWVFNQMRGRSDDCHKMDETCLSQWNDYFYDLEIIKGEKLTPHNKVFAVAVFDASMHLACMRNNWALTPL